MARFIDEYMILFSARGDFPPFCENMEALWYTAQMFIWAGIQKAS